VPTSDLTDARDQLAFSHLAAIYETFRAKGGGHFWLEEPNDRSFDLDRLPLYFVRRDAERRNVKAFLVNHPNPPAGAQRVDAALVSGVGEVYRYDEDMSALGSENYVIDARVAGVGMLAFPYSSGADDGENPDTFGYRAYLVHEAFHAYQRWTGAWREPAGADTEHLLITGEATYPSDEAYLALVLLEDRVLIAGLGASDTPSKTAALEQLVAIRSTRRALPTATDQGVNLADSIDGAKEWAEGTAYYVQLLYEEAQDSLQIDQRLIDELGGIEHVDPPTREQVVADISHARGYLSGAAIGRLLDQVDGVDWKSPHAAGTPQFDSLSAALELDPASFGGLVDRAKNTHDFADTIQPIARRLASYR